MENKLCYMKENGLMLYDLKRVADMIEVPTWKMLEHVEKVKAQLQNYSYMWILGEIDTIFKRFKEESRFNGYDNTAKELLEDISEHWESYNELVKDSVLNQMVDSWAVDVFIALLAAVGAEMPDKVEIVDRNEFGRGAVNV